MADIDRNDKCPCGSGKKAKKCCFINGTFQQPKPIQLGNYLNLPYKNDKCYANSLNECEGKITKEHYLSKSILDQIDANIKVEKFPWLHGESKTFSANALGSNVLCQRHNSIISRFDHKAAMLFEKIHYFSTCKKLDRPLKNLYSIFCSEDIERWMIKFVLGLIASNTPAEDYSKHIDKEMLNVLFKNQTLKGHQGFYLERYQHDETRFNKYVYIEIIAQSNKLVYAQINFSDLIFYFVFDQNYYNSTLIRPKSIVLKEDGYINTIEFCWAREVTERTDSIIFSP